MATWLTECKSVIQSCIKDNNDQIMNATSAVFQPKTVDKLVHYVWNHWDDPVDVIQHKVDDSRAFLYDEENNQQY